MIEKIITRTLSSPKWSPRTAPWSATFFPSYQRWLCTALEEVAVSPVEEKVPKRKDTKTKDELMPVPKPLFGKKALMKLRKKTGFSMSQCRKALMKHDLDLDAALKYLKEQVHSEEPIASTSKDVPCVFAEP